MTKTEEERMEKLEDKLMVIEAENRKMKELGAKIARTGEEQKG